MSLGKVITESTGILQRINMQVTYLRPP